MCVRGVLDRCSAARRQERTSTTRRPRATNEPKHPSRTFSIPRNNPTQRERSQNKDIAGLKAERSISAATGPKHTSTHDKPHYTPLAPNNGIRNKVAVHKIFPLPPAQNQRKTRRKDNRKTPNRPYPTRELSTQKRQIQTKPKFQQLNCRIHSSHKNCQPRQLTNSSKTRLSLPAASCARAHGVSSVKSGRWHSKLPSSPKHTRT